MAKSVFFHCDVIRTVLSGFALGRLLERVVSRHFVRWQQANNGHSCHSCVIDSCPALDNLEGVASYYISTSVRYNIAMDWELGITGVRPQSHWESYRITFRSL